MEPGHLLHSALTRPLSADARHLISRHPFVSAAQQLISSSDNIRVAHWLDHQRNVEWTDNPTRLCIFITSTSTHPPEWPSQEELGYSSTDCAPVSGVSTPVYTNGECLPLRPVRVAQKNKPSNMLSFNVQSNNHLRDCTARQFWTMRQSNGCSTPAPRSSTVKQWFDQLVRKKKNGKDSTIKKQRKHTKIIQRNKICLQKTFAFFTTYLISDSMLLVKLKTITLRETTEDTYCFCHLELKASANSCGASPVSLV